MAFFRRDGRILPFAFDDDVPSVVEDIPLEWDHYSLTSCLYFSQKLSDTVTLGCCCSNGLIIIYPHFIQIST